MDRFVIKTKKNNEPSVRPQKEPSEVNKTQKKFVTPKTYEENQVPEAFQLWKEQYSWLTLNPFSRAICSICTEACDKNLVAYFDSRKLNSKKTWVDTGFNNWKHAVQRIRDHSITNLHRSCTEALSSMKTVNVMQHLSTAANKQMLSNRIALNEIFTSLKLLSVQGLPLRGRNNDDASNLLAVLKARSEDVLDLETWLKRDGHKWIHHDIQNEIIHLMADEIMLGIMENVKSADFFSTLLDETADISRMEQVSVCFRTVTEDLIATENFIGFYTTKNTKGETLYELLGSVLNLNNLSISKLRGQCYDGASNVSGKISGLQSRIKEKEPRALFVHCNAHNLNLVVQDAMENVFVAKKFIGTIKDLLNFVRNSPKRVAQFQDLQQKLKTDKKMPALAAYCPTRWVVRITSLKTIRANYAVLMQFFDECCVDPEVESSISAKASGFYDQMESFEFIFFLTLCIEVFDRIEILNKELQSSELCVVDSWRKVNDVFHVLNSSRESKFELIWAKSIEAVDVLKICNPVLPRQRKTTKGFSSKSSDNYQFKTAKDFYRKLYYEVYDQVLTSLNTRFNNDSSTFLNTLENFVIGQPTDFKKIVEFYKDDFDEHRLLSDRDFFLGLVKRQNEGVKSLKDVVCFLQKYNYTRSIVPEYVKLIRLMMTIPGSSCSNERSFSILRRLKTYLRSTMTQDRLNDVAVMHIYREQADKIDIEKLINTFISRSSKRKAVFALQTV